MLRDPIVLAIVALSALNIVVMYVTQYPAALGIVLYEDLPRDPLAAYVVLGLTSFFPMILLRFNLLTTRALNEKVAAEKVAHHLAYHDQLTGLGNRRKLMQYLDNINQSAVRPGVAVLLIDLDGFKPVNDQFGHQAGDEVLAAVAQRLLAEASQSALVARIGGDEFAIVHTKDCVTALMEDAQNLAAAICGSLRLPIPLPESAHSQSVQISASIGVAYLAPASDPIDVLRAADGAMYAAKSAGKDGWQDTQTAA